jgi:hypothetical protein
MRASARPRTSEPRFRSVWHCLSQNGCIDRNGSVRLHAELAPQGLPERSLPHPSPPELGPESDRHAREPGERHRRLPEPKEVARKKTEARTRQ